MRRKLIQHGLSSLTVSLPSKWVKKNNLKKSDEIELEEQGERIIISTEKKYEHKKIDIDITDAHPMIRKIIGATFKSGYDEVNITFKSYEELKAVQDLMREQFSGFEITNQTRNTITIKNISKTGFEEFNTILRRFFHVLNQIASETSEAISKNDINWLKNITLMKVETDKYADYCRRAINMGYEIESKKTAPIYTIIEQLEKVVDRYKEMCDYISSNNIKTSTSIKTFMKEIAVFEEIFHKLFYKYEPPAMVEFGRKKDILQKELDKIALNCSKKEVKIVTLLDRILNLTFDLNGPLMTAKI
ncbi:MAG: AbrB/MazE/SpoVT family DNA-binding domain-containing protein [Candidatus Woesearchaeota archaeon]